ncbi:hypothetical protein ACFWAP_00345 [Streptomyces goshikiensis]|uniref:hypothetical protein n=1 Tax=Streptomyces goshikiensis TaxID=1942 RepID=UPI003656070C
MSNISYVAPMGVPQPGSPTYGGGGRTDMVGARSILDAKRMMTTARTPSAEYPDGYLGTLNTRRGERLGDAALNSQPMRSAQKSYTRGVHRGEKTNAGDYRWPADFGPMTALEYQARGQKWTQTGDSIPGRHLVGSGAIQEAQDQDRTAALRRLRPQWR